MKSLQRGMRSFGLFLLLIMSAACGSSGEVVSEFQPFHQDRFFAKVAPSGAEYATSFIYPLLGPGVDDPKNNIVSPIVLSNSAECSAGSGQWNKNQNDFAEEYLDSCPVNSCGEPCYHPGEDWNLCGGVNIEGGTQVYAVANGKVKAKGAMANGGYYLTIEHTLPSAENLSTYVHEQSQAGQDFQNVTTVYSAYLHINDSPLNVDDIVEVGVSISTISDCCSHLHFEMRLVGASSGRCGTAQQGAEFCGYCDSYQDLTDSSYINPSTFIQDHVAAIPPPEPDQSCRPEPNPQNQFSDVPLDAWFAGNIYGLAKCGVANGFADGTFRPAQNVTRAEFLKMILGAAEPEWRGNTPPRACLQQQVYNDVHQNDWFCPYVLEAYEREWLDTAKPDFHPNDNINRAEAVAMLLRGLDIPARNMEIADANEFTDLQDESAWFYDPVYVAQDEGIISGYPDNTFRPANFLNRAEAAALIIKAPFEVKVTDAYAGQEFEQQIAAAGNGAPVASMSLRALVVRSGDEVNLHLQQSSDRDGDELFYFWEASGGRFVAWSANYDSVRWRAPIVGEASDYIIVGSVGDARGLIDREETAVRVLPAGGAPACPTLAGPPIVRVDPLTDRYRVEWTEADGEDHYIFQEDTDANFGSPRELQFDRNRQWEFVDQAVNATYYLRMRAVNECGTGPWGPTFSFTLNTNHYPERPVAVSPLAGAVNVSLNTQICWASSHPEGRPIQYHLYFQEGGLDVEYYSGNSLRYEGPQNCWTPPAPLNYGSTYKWKVYATDDDGSEIQSVTYTFTTGEDVNPPSGSIQIDGGAANTDTFWVSLVLTGQDAESGLASMSFSNDGTTWSPWDWFNESKVWDLRDPTFGGRIQQNNNYTVHFRLKDQRGNISATFSDTIQKVEGEAGVVTLNGKTYESLRQAVSLAQAGDTVYLSPGVWQLGGSEIIDSRAVHLNLPPGVHLVGAGWDKTKLVTTVRGIGVWMQAGSTVSSLTIDGNNATDELLIPNGDNQISHCRFTGARWQGILLKGQNLPVTTVRNSIFESNQEGLRVSDSATGSSIRIWNSVFVNNVNGIFWFMNHPDSELINNTVAYSQVCNLAGADPLLGNLDIRSNNFFQGNGGGCFNPAGNGNISVDPLFVNRGARNFRLQAGSPLINTGNPATGLPFVGAAPDIGAYEYNAVGTLEVNTGNAAARFVVSGDGNYEGSGAAWQQANVPAGMYTISFFPIANFNTPLAVTQFLEPGQNLSLQAPYTADQQGPTGTLEVNFSEYATYNSEVVLRLRVEDLVAGIGEASQMRFSNDGQSWSQPVSFAPIFRNWNLAQFGGNAQSGAKTVYAQVSDQLGNWSLPLTDAIQYVANRTPLVVPENFATIQSAFNAAQPGDTVWVMPGLYREGESLTVPAGVRLQGSGSDLTTLSGTMRLSANSQIDGFSVRGGRPQVELSAGASIVSNLRFLHPRGLDILGIQSPVFIRNNVFSYADGVAPYAEMGVLIFNPQSQAYIENNVFSRLGAGIRSEGQQHALVTLRHNIFSSLTYLYYNQAPLPDSPNQILFETNNEWQFNTRSDPTGSQEGVVVQRMQNIDPLFVNAAQYDYRLQENSSLRESGLPDPFYQNLDGTVNTLGIEGGMTYNSRPTARFIAQLQADGTTLLDPAASFDGQDDRSQLLVRWDLDGNGSFETPWETFSQKHVQLVAGNHNVGLQVRDSGFYLGTVSQQVQVLNHIPLEPNNPRPANHLLAVPRDVALQWDASDLDADALSYDVLFAAEGAALQPVAQNQAANLWQPGALLQYETKYFWQIIAHDASGGVVQGPVWDFITVPNPDSDGDGVPDLQDACPNVVNDAVGDPCVPNDCADRTLRDNIGDACQHDEDQDGVLDAADLCPQVSDPQQANFDNDGMGDICDDDVDGDSVVNADDHCSFTPVGDAQLVLGCSLNQNLCQSLNDIQDHPYEGDICGVVDPGYWPLQPAQAEFQPDADVTLSEEIYTILNAAGFGEAARNYQGGICPNDSYLSYAINQRILKYNSCPNALAIRSLAGVIVEVGRALLKKPAGSDRFWSLAASYDGPDFGDFSSPYGISTSYFKVAYELGALIDFDPQLLDVNDQAYGRQVISKAEAAFVIARMLEIQERLVDIQGHQYETEIRTLTDTDFWPLAPGSARFEPDEEVTLSDEIRTILNAAGFGEAAKTYQGGLCPNDPYLSYAISQNIVKTSVCPNPLARRALVSVIVEAGRALLKKPAGSDRFWSLSRAYDGPDYGAVSTPYGISTSYFNVAYELGALIDFDPQLDPNSQVYGRRILTRAETAFVIARMLELGEGGVDVPEHIAYLQHAQEFLGLAANFNINDFMIRGDLIGLAMRLMKLQGCINYPDPVDNPFSNIPANYPYLPELSAAVGMGVIRSSEGSFGGARGTWVWSYQRGFDRRSGALWLDRLLRNVAQCEQREQCPVLWEQERANIIFHPDDNFALASPVQAVCAYVLNALPLAQIDEQNRIQTEFDGIPEGEESLVTLYRMLQVDVAP